jgi:hypothetical protein
VDTTGLLVCRNGSTLHRMIYCDLVRAKRLIRYRCSALRLKAQSRTLPVARRAGGTAGSPNIIIALPLAEEAFGNEPYDE